MKACVVMWLPSTLIFAFLLIDAEAQDCVTCLTVPCQFSPPYSQACYACLKSLIPTSCASEGDCNSYFNGQGTGPCCTLVSNILNNAFRQQYQPDVIPGCNASSPATPRSSVGAMTLPSVSSNGQPLQFIMPQMNFSCGCYQTLNITLNETVRDNATFLFQLWKRYTPTPSSQTSAALNVLYQLNYSVPLIINADTASSSNVYSLPLNVCISEGDTIGIQLPSNSILRIALDNSGIIYKREIPATCGSDNVFATLWDPSANITGRPLLYLFKNPPMLPLVSSVQTTIPAPSITASILTSVPPTGSPVLPTGPPVLPTGPPVAPTVVATGPSSSIVVPVAASAGGVLLVLIAVVVVVVSTLAVCRRRKSSNSWGRDEISLQNAPEEITFKTFENGKLPTSRRGQTTYKTEDGLSVQYDIPRHAETVSSKEGSHFESRVSPSLTADSIGPCSLVPHSPEPQEPRGELYDYPAEMDARETRRELYDYPAEMDARPIASQEHPGQEMPPRPQNPISNILDQTGSSTIDETKDTQSSSDDNTSLASSLASFDVTAPSPHHKEQEQKTNIYHVLENTERDPATGNRYHVLEEHLRTQDDQSPKYGVYVPNARQRERISRHGEKAWTQKSRTKMEKDKKFFHDKGQFWYPASDDRELYEQFSKYRFREILREDISVGDELGSGAFGTVYKAVWKFSGGKMGVAVKVMKQSIAQGAKVRFLQEAAVMGQFFHPNVVKLHGVVTVGEPPMIVLELMPRGDLSSFLKNYHTPGERPPPTPTFLLLCSRDIVCGMKYLSYKGFVHRDLAARNILLTEDLKCKIGDFGLSRDLDENPYYISHKGTIPLKWSAPEAFMHGKFSTSSDVYSYGMLLFEIWSCGCKPMANVPMEEAKRLLAEGYCQPPPPGCPRGIYQVMVQCWNPQHSYRPSFGEIHEYLSASDETILAWSSSDKEVSQQATVLGAPLSEGVELYKDLQQTYRPLEMT